jgi:uncharacterized protein
MSKTRKEKIDEVMEALMQVGDIKAICIVSKEGLLINSMTPADVDARIFSALCSTIMGAAEAASEQMATGPATQVSVKTDKGTIVLIPGGSKVILAVLTEPESQLGLILFEMESRAKQVEEIFRET